MTLQRDVIEDVSDLLPANSVESNLNALVSIFKGSDDQSTKALANLMLLVTLLAEGTSKKDISNFLKSNNIVNGATVKNIRLTSKSIKGIYDSNQDIFKYPPEKTNVYTLFKKMMQSRQQNINNERNFEVLGTLLPVELSKFCKYKDNEQTIKNAPTNIHSIIKKITHSFDKTCAINIDKILNFEEVGVSIQQRQQVASTHNDNLYSPYMPPKISREQMRELVRSIDMAKNRVLNTQLPFDVSNIKETKEVVLDTVDNVNLSTFKSFANLDSDESAKKLLLYIVGAICKSENTVQYGGSLYNKLNPFGFGFEKRDNNSTSDEFRAILLTSIFMPNENLGRYGSLLALDASNGKMHDTRCMHGDELISMISTTPRAITQEEYPSRVTGQLNVIKNVKSFENPSLPVEALAFRINYLLENKTENSNITRALKYTIKSLYDVCGSGFPNQKLYIEPNKLEALKSDVSLKQKISLLYETAEKNKNVLYSNEKFGVQVTIIDLLSRVCKNTLEAYNEIAFNNKKKVERKVTDNIHSSYSPKF